MAVTVIRSRRKHALQWLYVVICLIGFYAIVPQLDDFHHGLNLWRKLALKYLVLLIASFALTYFTAAETYTLLALKRLQYLRTVMVQVASTFINHLLPASVGGIGSNYAYLRRAKLTPSEASATVTVNNSLGLIGHLILLIAITLYRPKALGRLELPHLTPVETVLVVVFVVAAMIAVRCIPRLQTRLRKALHNFARQLVRYQFRRGQVALALLSSMCLTLANVSALWFASLALGISVSFFVVLIVFTIGVGVGSVTPTPGGVGGVEAGLIGGLVAYHYTAATALAVVLLYRFVTYWLAIVVGAIVFVIVKKKHYL